MVGKWLRLFVTVLLAVQIPKTQIILPPRAKCDYIFGAGIFIGFYQAIGGVANVSIKYCKCGNVLVECVIASKCTCFQKYFIFVWKRIQS